MFYDVIRTRFRASFLATTLLFGLFPAHAADENVPRIIWASDPVLPNETVLLMGGPFAKESKVLFSIFANKENTQPDEPQDKDFKSIPIAPLQVSDQSIKFVVPGNMDKGIYYCSVECAGKQSNGIRLNAPAPWWIQGDQGASATVGGWLRVQGKSLHLLRKSSVALKDSAGKFTMLDAIDTVAEGGMGGGYSLNVKIPSEMKPGAYGVFVHNGCGGGDGWSGAGNLEIKAAEAWPATVFNVLDFYGNKAEQELLRTIRRGSKPVDRTEAIDAALAKAKANGGGVVFFPEGTYAYSGELKVPARTVIKGEGMGVVSLWWGSGQFALDGGGAQDKTRQQVEIKPLPPTLISGSDFKLEEFSMYIPLECNMAISAGDGFRMNKVRVRVDRYWGRTAERQNGNLIRVKSNFEITNCDILAKASAVILGHNGRVANNRIQAGKINCELAHSSNIIVEDNQFVSLDPTAYNNLYEEGRNIYYARNRHESQYVHQSDYSFTFDGPGGCYLGKLTAWDGTNVGLADDPTYLKWAGENSSLWKNSVVCILSGKGAGQYRFVTVNKGRNWTIDRAFDIAPDAESVVSIVPYRGKLLVIGNRFEDASWVNMGYGSSFDVICANNSLYRCSQLLNYGLNLDSGRQPSWYVQYLNNDIYEGHTQVQTLGMSAKNPGPISANPITRCAIHRGQHIHADNSGSIEIDDDATDCIVEHCMLDNPRNTIDARGHPVNTVFRENTFENGPSPRYSGKALGEVLVVPEAGKK